MAEATQTVVNQLGYNPETAPYLREGMGQLRGLTYKYKMKPDGTPILGANGMPEIESFRDPETYGYERQAAFSDLQKQAMQGARDMGPAYQNVDATGIMGAAARNSLNAGYAPSTFGNQYQAPSNLGYDAQQASAASAGPAERFYGENAYAAQLGAAPMAGYQQFGGPRDVNAERVNTRSFTGEGTAGSYMSPYMQNVVDIQQREAQRQADIAGTARKSAATSRGAFGGSRSAIMDAEADRNLATQKGDIQAQGLQAAYQQAQQQFNAEQGYGLQAQQANQQTGLSAQQSNQGMDYNTGMQNAQLRQQMGLANQAQLGQYGLQQGQFNQAANAQTSAQRQAAGMGNQQAANQMAQYNAGNLQQANFANQNAANQAAQFGAGQRLTSAGTGAQYGQAANQLNEQSGQFGANYNLQGQQAAMQGATGLANIGNQGFGQNMQVNQLLAGYGNQQQQQEQQRLSTNYQDFLNQQNDPYKKLGFMMNQASAAPTANVGSTMYTAPPSMLSQVGGFGAAALGAYGASGGFKANGGMVGRYAKGGLVRSRPQGLVALAIHSMT